MSYDYRGNHDLLGDLEVRTRCRFDRPMGHLQAVQREAKI